MVLCQAMDVIRGEGDEGKDDGVSGEADEPHQQGDHLTSVSHNALTSDPPSHSFLLPSESLLLIGHQTGVRLTGLQGREKPDLHPYLICKTSIYAPVGHQFLSHLLFTSLS